ncbi:hypothetical protein [Streptomyces sp. MUM 178J]|uniref:hypothetical protein n=1 Tax=Streptomyces sp. MUM 178J TaxID=2791991 RepID=UPI001F046730|nr:hypothetical protein [Streptomyces sp. MUM 178J]WRQ81660.1 hypothetical protein I3F59_021160 [Streptomyces sp. MUM 178J]
MGHQYPKFVFSEAAAQSLKELGVEDPKEVIDDLTGQLHALDSGDIVKGAVRIQGTKYLAVPYENHMVMLRHLSKEEAERIGASGGDAFLVAGFGDRKRLIVDPPHESSERGASKGM